MKSWYQTETKLQISSIKDHMETDPVIAEFLAKLDLLYDVPSSYLLPSDDMLKEEQMCFFYLDMEWIRCLQQGALSIGATSGAEKAWNKEAHQFYSSEIRRRSSNLRRKSLRLLEREETHSVRTGFFLRSEAVRCWPGIEVTCWSDKNQREKDTQLEILRLEKIAGDTLLCIASGEIKLVELSQPFEGIYMEAKKKEIDILFRENSDGVLDIRSIANGFFKENQKKPEEFGALFLHKQKRYRFTPDTGGTEK